MDLYEYQGKELLRQHGLATLPGRVAETPEEAREAAEEIGGTVAVKAQVLTGGRGKAGGIKVVSSPEEAQSAAEQILGMDIKGHTVRRVYIEGGAEIATEMYLSVLVDREAKKSLVLFSTEGGVEIEQVAEENPDALVRLHIDPLVGLMPYQVREVTFASGLTGDSAKQFGKAFQNLYKTFESVDASLVEINPLVVTESGDVLALDAKVTVDNSSLYRHKDIAELHDVEAADPQEQRAQEADLQYVKLDGNVGILGNGAGLVMSTLDVVAQAGGSPANFCDVGGGADADKIATALDIVTSNEKVTGVFFNIFGGITRGDEVAKGLLSAIEKTNISLPIVVRLDGTNAEEGREILAENTPENVHTAETMLEAARMAVELSGKGGN
ncbi:sucCoAbeta: succinate-CoA ligase, beta subunit [Rubrobacter radiotolerans]|uniref:Succinate--CoA ligase [ADP-forming] subunit beta n=1 Tax=Rubrobacter radiotolerans TaxID=42256 RepID=A0A023X3D9_RUBRA|nr:ADP-forming succinate--CoA ligase subunit beta [Rubrobacter radiotolerans]AHY46535.1 sucCoAbeta: succinate-CoA ligase, beta subunit [Rubrobacter radiotolerans]SMC04824.1 succinyl-CoA synthetase (ADP-forming) beta subunit [Rubrobacter radiotolerans DSM 5868]